MENFGKGKDQLKKMAKYNSKHNKGWGWFVHPNAGNVEYNNSVFNSMMGINKTTEPANSTESIKTSIGNTSTSEGGEGVVENKMNENNMLKQHDLNTYVKQYNVTLVDKDGNQYNITPTIDYDIYKDFNSEDDVFNYFQNLYDDKIIDIYILNEYSLNEDLIQSDSDEAFKKNVETEIKAGKPRKQALAIAYSVREKNRMKKELKEAVEDKIGMERISTPRGTFRVYFGTWKDFKNEPDSEDWGLWFDYQTPERSWWEHPERWYKIMHNHNTQHAVAVLYKDYTADRYEKGYMNESQEMELNEDLIQSDSDEAFKKNVETEMKAGKPRKQALAIAYSVKEKNRMKEDLEDKIVIKFEPVMGDYFKGVQNAAFHLSSKLKALKDEVDYPAIDFTLDKDSFEKHNVNPKEFYNDLVDELRDTYGYGLSSKESHYAENPTMFDYTYTVSELDESTCKNTSTESLTETAHKEDLDIPQEKEKCMKKELKESTIFDKIGANIANAKGYNYIAYEKVSDDVYGFLFDDGADEFELEFTEKQLEPYGFMSEEETDYEESLNEDTKDEYIEYLTNIKGWSEEEAKRFADYFDDYDDLDESLDDYIVLTFKAKNNMTGEEVVESEEFLKEYLPKDKENLFKFIENMVEFDGKDYTVLEVIDSKKPVRYKGKVSKSEIESDIKKIIRDAYSEFDEDEYNDYIGDYLYVDVSEGTTEDNDEYVKVEIRADMGYDELSDLAYDKLDPYIQKHDKDAYFDFERPGIINAYLHRYKLTEGKMKEIDIEMQDAGGKEAYIKQLENELKTVRAERHYLDTIARSQVNRGGAYDNEEEVNEAIAEYDKDIASLEAKLKIVRG